MAKARKLPQPNVVSPVRVVVELTKDEFTRLEKGASGYGVASFLKIAGIRVAEIRASELKR